MPYYLLYAIYGRWIVPNKQDEKTMKRYRSYISLSKALWSGVVVLCWIFTPHSTTLIEAQLLKSTVFLDISRLPQDKQKKLEGLQETIQQYIDDSRWLDEPHDFEVPFTFTIAEMMDISETYEDRYSTKFQASNNRDIQYKDRYCRFPYQMNEPLLRDDFSYDPFTGLIDYYVYMVFGGEMDKRAILGGTPFYQKALDVCMNAGFSQTEFYKGWDERKDLVENIMSEEWETFRKLQAIFFKAKVLYTQGKSNKARQYCRVVILELGKMFDTDPEDVRVKDFLKYHYFEIGELFKDKKDPALFQRLIELDPSHREDYEKYID